MPLSPVTFCLSFISKHYGLVKVDGDISLKGWLFNTIYVRHFFGMETSSLLFGPRCPLFMWFTGYNSSTEKKYL